MESKKPSNYRERLSDVNLIAECLTILVQNFTHCKDFSVSPSTKQPHLMLQIDRIRFILNDFRPQHQRSRVSMHLVWLPLAAFKPALWRQKYERQYEHTQDVPLPCISGISPEEDLLEKPKQIYLYPPVRRSSGNSCARSEGAPDMSLSCPESHVNHLFTSEP
jgi:hypothetical protein